MYNHSINLKLEDRVTLLHGPNGVGKTSVLRMTNALLGGNLAYFRAVPVDCFLLHFHDGTHIEIRECSNSSGPKSTHQLSLSTPGDHHSAKLNLNLASAQSIAKEIDYLRPYEGSSDTWIDMRDDEILTASEVILRYGNPNAEAGQLDTEYLEWFRPFQHKAQAHLIEAQRLIQTARTSGRARYYRVPPAPVSSVFRCGRDFQKRLAVTMADYGRRAQTLDQSFPQRLISATKTLPVNELQDKMTALDKKTGEFKEIGILDETPVHPFDIGSLGDASDTTQARVMTLYVEDTEQKLAALNDLASRAHLFLDNVNKKYRHKRIRLDREAGLVAIGEKDQQLSLDLLSSGEQHELVLHYDLLFRVPQNTVVLIDEPELSLHVAWQKRFLPDLLDIVELTQFDALVATHSPYIVGDKDDLMVALSDSLKYDNS